MCDCVDYSSSVVNFDNISSMLPLLSFPLSLMPLVSSSKRARIPSTSVLLL